MSSEKSHQNGYSFRGSGLSKVPGVSLPRDRDLRLAVGSDLYGSHPDNASDAPVPLPEWSELAGETAAANGRAHLQLLASCNGPVTPAQVLGPGF